MKILQKCISSSGSGSGHELESFFVYSRGRFTTTQFKCMKMEWFLSKTLYETNSVPRTFFSMQQQQQQKQIKALQGCAIAVFIILSKAKGNKMELYWKWCWFVLHVNESLLIFMCSKIIFCKDFIFIKVTHTLKIFFSTESEDINLSTACILHGNKTTLPYPEATDTYTCIIHAFNLCEQCVNIYENLRLHVNSGCF